MPKIKRIHRGWIQVEDKLINLENVSCVNIAKPGEDGKKWDVITRGNGFIAYLFVSEVEAEARAFFDEIVRLLK